MWLPAALATLLVGAFLSSVLAFFIGISISEEDVFQFNEILKKHLILLGTVISQG